MNAAAAKAALANWRPPVEPAKPAPPSAPVTGVPDAPASTAPPQTPTATTGVSGKRIARYAGKLGAALTVSVSASSIRKRGRVPNDPDDDDVQRLEDAIEEGIKEQYGDLPVPWYLGAALAAGGVYAGMRIGAKKQDDSTPVIGEGEAKRDEPEPEEAAEPEAGEMPTDRFSSIRPSSMLKGQ